MRSGRCVCGINRVLRATLALWCTSAWAAPPGPEPNTPVRLSGTSAARAKRVWRVMGGGMNDGVVLDGRGSAFLFDPAARVPFAIDTRTGQRRWAGEGNPEAPEHRDSSSDRGEFWRQLPRWVQRAEGGTLDNDRTRLVLAGDTLLVRSDTHLEGYSAMNGQRLWSRTEQCELFGGAKPLVLVDEKRTSKLGLPDQDRSLRGQPRFVPLDEDITVDLDRQSVVARPTLRPEEARPTEDWRERRKGIYARRGDGTELSGPPEPESREAPLGPLRWVRPIKN